MTRQEFDTSFKPMVKALAVKVSPDQANVFWDEFQHHDKRDFAHACRELSMGNPGYLPKLVFFRDNVVAAKEMRQEKENTHSRAILARNLAIGGAGDEWDQRFGKLCLLNILHIVLGQDKAKERVARRTILAALDDPELQGHVFDWESRDGQRPQDWLRQQVAR